MGSPANQAVCCRARWYSETKRCSQAMGRHLPRCSQPVWECRVWTRRTRDKCRDSMYRPYGQERWTWSAQGGGGHTVPGPNLAKGQILANVALCRVCQWQTFVHVQGEGLVRVHVQPLQRRQSTQVRGRQPPLPRGLCEHLLDHQSSRWREILACNDNTYRESKGQNSHDSLLDLTFLTAATDPKAPIY